MIKDLKTGETDRNTNAGEEHNGEVVGEHGDGILLRSGDIPRSAFAQEEGEQRGLIRFTIT